MRKKQHIRGIALLLFLFLTLPLFCISLSAEDNALPQADQVDAFCVINTDYKKVLLEKNMNQPIYPASTVKLMTALVAYDHFSGRLEHYILITEEIISHFVGGRISFSVGEYVRIIDLLHALLCSGDNNSAIILAYASCGGIDAFCEEMNQKAKALGALHTHYKNPTGLHDTDMVTNAYDTTLISLAIFENEELYEITKKFKYTMPTTNKNQERTIYNRNPLITTNTTEDYFYSYAEGISAGGTDEAGDCVVTSGSLDGLSYLCVVMGGRPAFDEDETNHACIAAKNLLRYSLVNYEVKLLRECRNVIAELPLRFSATEEFVPIKMTKDLSALLHNNVDVETDIRFDIDISVESLDAPISAGTVVGTIQAVYQGEILDSAELVTANDVQAHSFLIFMYKTKVVTSHPVFIVLFVCAIIALVYVLLRRFPINKKKDRHKRNRYF